MAEQSFVGKKTKTAGAVLAIVIGVYVAFLPPPEGLTVAAMKALGIAIWAVVFWVLEIMPEYVTGLIMCTLWSMLKVVPFDRAFANFSASTWWILVGAFGLGVAATKCGLLKRISLVILKLFPPTFLGQVLGLLGAGLVVSPLIPSGNARGAIASPIALAISDSLRYERKSPGACGLFGAMFLGFCVIGSPLFLSGSFTNYVTVGLFPKSYQDVTWTSWLLAALPWGVIVFTGMALAIYLLYKPADSVALPRQFGAEQLANLGPMSRDEKITMIVLLTTLLLWMTETLHKIASGEVAVASICALLALKVINREDFRKGIDWAAVIYIGCILNMATVVQVLKIDVWLGHTLESTIASFLSNIYLFLLVLVLTIYLARLIVVSMTSTAVIFTLILTPVVTAHGIHPWIIAFVAFASANIWYFFFMNGFYLLAFYATGGEMVEHRKMIKLSLAYSIVSIIGFLASVPYWEFLGLIR